jgi:hypothetical protein
VTRPDRWAGGYTGGVPQLSEFVISAPVEAADEPAQTESLLLALRALLASHGRDVPYHELAGVTGVATMVTCVEHEACPAAWTAHGRHAFLVEAALQYGLRLRDLHPPEAAPLPRTPPEFEGHFRDSYLPLIRTALEHGQPVLAWMGWPAPHEREWGVITAMDGDVCVGHVPGGAQMQRLEHAAVQAYVVQDCAAPPVPASELLKSAVARMRRALLNELPQRYGVVSGVEAVRYWRARLDDESFCPIHRDEPWRCVWQFARNYLELRGHGVCYLLDYGYEIVSDRLPCALSGTISAAGCLGDLDNVREIWHSPPLRADVVTVFERTMVAEQEAADIWRERA